MPALFTSTLIRPNVRSTSPNTDFTSDSLLTSKYQNCALPPASTISSTARRPAPSRTSVSATVAPSRARRLQAERPMPCAPPVTTATFPATLLTYYPSARLRFGRLIRSQRCRVQGPHLGRLLCGSIRLLIQSLPQERK